MKKRYALLLTIGFYLLALQSINAQVFKYDSYPVYEGKDLGLTFSNTGAKFRIWAPTAREARLWLYDNDSSSGKYFSMISSDNGTWTYSLKGNYKNKYYCFQVLVQRKPDDEPYWSREIPDPYAKAVGANGLRAQIIDLKETDPIGWDRNKSNSNFAKAQPAIIYELQIRDANMSANSGIVHKGKYLGLTETSTKNIQGETTGLDYIAGLGVTHVHLLPCFDFRSIDENKKPFGPYNWGYDPQNYNVPEGSFATSVTDGKTRIIEFKKMVQAFHSKGLKVVMDVVYNHLGGNTELSNFDQLVPGYYFRHNADGSFSNASACSNETASERPMFRKFMLESLLHWAKEYQIDGFRFDLMGIHDIETMNLISDSLHKINPSVLIYGEGWTAGASPLPDSLRALKNNAYKLKGISVFSDDIRDGIKGSVFESTSTGFVSGNKDALESIKFGIAGATKHSQVNLAKVNYSHSFYTNYASQLISYADCHDNNTLWDKLALSASTNTEAQRIEMQKLAFAIVLTSQGTPFIHAGSEFLRTKKGVDNSFESSDSINAIDWSLRSKNEDVYLFVRALISMKKNHPIFHLETASQLEKGLHFFETSSSSLLGFSLDGSLVGDKWKKVQVWFNGSESAQSIQLVGGANWKIFIADNFVNEKDTSKIDSWNLKPHSCLIVYQD